MKRTMKRLLSALLLCTVLTCGLSLPASAARFTDVPANFWAAESISRCADLGVFQGKTATRFGVGEPMSRGAFAVVLTRFFGWEKAQEVLLPYTDVPADAWYARDLATAFNHGAVTTQSHKFRPGEAITREEMAVALVRALGYAPLSGMAQKLSLPFTDVSTNRGYITMALNLGLINGTSETTFSPDRPATREQAAVILMRLYDKLHAGTPERAALVDQLDHLPDLTAFDVLAAGRGELTGGQQPKLLGAMGSGRIRTLRKTSDGAKLLLHVTGDAEKLVGTNAAAAAGAIRQEMNDGGYDGVFLNLSHVGSGHAGQLLLDLTRQLHGMLGGKLLYVVMEAPSTAGSGAPVSYEAMEALVSRLVLRAASPVTEAGGMAVAPAEPLEEIYYALWKLEKFVSRDKVSLWLSTTATAWDGTEPVSTLTGSEVERLLEAPSTETHYSQRYGSAYLTGTLRGQDVTVWYPDARGMADRVELGRLLGVHSVMLDSVCSMSEDQVNGLH